MAVKIASTRKVVVISWDTEVVKGSHASMQVSGEEKRNVDNDGKANLYFPADFAGNVRCDDRRLTERRGHGHDQRRLGRRAQPLVARVRAQPLVLRSRLRGGFLCAIFGKPGHRPLAQHLVPLLVGDRPLGFAT